MLRLERHPRTQLILLTDEAQRHGRIVVVVSVLRILCPGYPRHATRIRHGKGPLMSHSGYPAYRMCLVALTVLVLELIAELQESGARNRFAVRT